MSEIIFASFELTLRSKVIEIARSWLGTPFMDGQGLKHCGVDCAYFPARVAEEAGIVSHVEIPHYSPQIFLHKKPDGSWDDTYERIIHRYAHEITETEVKPGDLVLFRVAHSYTHGGIIESWPDKILHPIRPHGVIYSDLREGFIKGRAKKFFSVFPLEMAHGSIGA